MQQPLIILRYITSCKAFSDIFPCIRVGIGVQQGSLYLEQVLGAYREAAQAKVQILRRVGRVAHGKAADGHRDVVRAGGIHHHGDQLFHGRAGGAVVVLLSLIHILYLEPGASQVETLALIAARMEAAGIPYTVETEGVEQEDWQNGWRKYYHPMEIGSRLAVVPSWQQYDTNRVKLILDPGLAFGTGGHETTSLCLEAVSYTHLNRASIAFCAALCYAFSKGVDKMDARTFGNYLSRMRKAQGPVSYTHLG